MMPSGIARTFPRDINAVFLCFIKRMNVVSKLNLQPHFYFFSIPFQHDMPLQLAL